MRATISYMSHQNGRTVRFRGKKDSRADYVSLASLSSLTEDDYLDDL